MSYVVGFSSGAFGVTTPEERPQLAGLFRKAQASITKGVNFVQLDLESLSEFEEPDLEKNMEENVRNKLGINYGIHSETKAFGVEAAELDSAVKMEYDRAHERLIQILYHSKRIGSKYVLVHSSESEPFPLLERTLQAADLVDPQGNLFKDFLRENEDLLKWLMGGEKETIKECVLKAWREKKMEIKPEDIAKAFEEKEIKPQDFIWMELYYGRRFDEILVNRIKNRVESEEVTIGKKYEDMPEELKKRVNDGVERSLDIDLEDRKAEILSIVQSRSLHYGPERLAYYFVAKWMETKKDPLWEKIVMATIKFFARRAKKSVEEWAASNNIDLNKLSIDEDNFRRHHELWVPAVSARYIYGHFFPTRQDLKDPKQYLDGMIFAFESPMGGRGIEEWLRLSNPYVYYFLVEEANKKAGKEIFAVAMDFEHMLSLRVDPATVIELLPEEGGKHVRIIHAGWPSTLAPAHLPIEIGSDQQRYLYQMYYKLRQKGFGKDKECYIIFERGGPETFQQSIVSLKLIVEFLEKDTPPEKLPLEFFGLDVGQIASTERQLTAIREHAFDPLKGLITVPEEEHGFLGRAAVEKGKAEEWRKEKYR